MTVIRNMIECAIVGSIGECDSIAEYINLRSRIYDAPEYSRVDDGVRAKVAKTAQGHVWMVG